METFTKMECGLRWFIITQIDLLLDRVFQREEDESKKSTHFQVIFFLKENSEYEMTIKLFKDEFNHNYIETIATEPFKMVIPSAKIVEKLANTIQIIEVFKEETNRNCESNFGEYAIKNFKHN